MSFTCELCPWINIVIQFTIDIYLCFGGLRSDHNRQRFFKRNIIITIEYELSATTFLEHQLVFSCDCKGITTTIAMTNQSEFFFWGFHLGHLQCNRHFFQGACFAFTFHTFYICLYISCLSWKLKVRLRVPFEHWSVTPFVFLFPSK